MQIYYMYLYIVKCNDAELARRMVDILIRQVVTERLEAYTKAFEEGTTPQGMCTTLTVDRDF